MSRTIPSPLEARVATPNAPADLTTREDLSGDVSVTRGTVAETRASQKVFDRLSSSKIAYANVN
jgi:hypothetical protein